MGDTYCRVNGSGGHWWVQAVPGRTVIESNDYGRKVATVTTTLVQSCACGEVRVVPVPR